MVPSHLMDGGGKKRKTMVRKVPNRLNQQLVTVKHWKDIPKMQGLGSHQAALESTSTCSTHLPNRSFPHCQPVYITVRSVQTSICTHTEPHTETAGPGDSLGSPWRTSCYCTYFVSPSFLIRHTRTHTPLTGSLQLWICVLLLSWQETSFIRGVESLTRMGNGNNKRM